MEIQIPKNIHLNRPERYILTIEVHPEQFSFSLCNPGEEKESFYYRIPREAQSDAFSCFRDVFFENEFFTIPFKKVFIINYTPVFTYIPSILFEEKDKNEYMDFLFTSPTGKILSQTLSKPEITILHEMPEEVYEFFQRTFVDSQIVHPTAPLITYFQDKEEKINSNRLIINRQGKEADILCFSGETLLLCNHFTCPQIVDAVYYSLFIWKQLKFDQLKDFIYIVGNDTELAEQLGVYVHNIIPVEVSFQMTTQALCEL
ncbi:MAG: DUF3822 family protein [Candidatus Symbiothrix sp.]|jgi:hypothetical protein|nr:DUF3822 family protein [Candidatus Symbiothrix sp.]